MTHAANCEALSEWIGPVLPHPYTSDIRALVQEGCRLLSHRPLGDVHAMLTAIDQLAECAETDEPPASLPPPGFNWELRATAIGQLITEHHGTLSASIKAEPWEFVAAIALHSIRKAVQTLRAAPIGITGTPTPSPHTHRLISNTQWWLRRALLERRQAAVYAYDRLREGQRKGVEGKARQEERQARHRAILDEGAELKNQNPEQSVHGIALKLNARHKGEPGWSVRAITQVLRNSGSI